MHVLIIQRKGISSFVFNTIINRSYSNDEAYPEKKGMPTLVTLIAMMMMITHCNSSSHIYPNTYSRAPCLLTKTLGIRFWVTW